MFARETLGPNETADVIIIGGGVIGLTIARALARRGVRDVMLIERGRPGAEASWAAGGILAPQVEADEPDDFFRLSRRSRDMYPDFAEVLHEDSGVDVELDRTGTLYLGFTPEDEEDLWRRFDWQQDEGLHVERLTAKSARRLEPCISPKVLCALRFPDDFQIENRRLVEALVIANDKLGVRLITGCTVGALRIEQEKVRGVEVSSRFVSAPIVVVAAGAWTSLIDWSSSSLPPFEIEPVRGQMLCFEAQPQIARHVIYSARGYLVPRRDGRLLAGSTTEYVGFDKSVTADGVDSIKSMALEIVPTVADLPLLASWAGFRPRAADDLPVLGSCDEIDGLFYATGHYRNGILLAPITGELIADAIVEGNTTPTLDAFSPGRFRIPSGVQ